MKIWERRSGGYFGESQ